MHHARQTPSSAPVAVVLKKRSIAELCNTVAAHWSGTAGIGAFMFEHSASEASHHWTVWMDETLLAEALDDIVEHALKRCAQDAHVVLSLDECGMNSYLVEIDGCAGDGNSADEQAPDDVRTFMGARAKEILIQHRTRVDYGCKNGECFVTCLFNRG